MFTSPDGSLPLNSEQAKIQKVKLPTGATVTPQEGSKLGPGKGNNGRGGGSGLLESRWTPVKK